MVQTIPLVQSSLLDSLPELDAGRPWIVLRPQDFHSWSKVFDKYPDFDDYRLAPGDYRSWGMCVINKANPAGRRRLIRFVDTAKRPPWDRINEEAVTQGFEFTSGAAYWAVQGLTMRGLGLAMSTVRPGAEHITFDSLLIEDVDHVHTMRLFGNHCTVQNSVIRRAWHPAHDAIGVTVAVSGVPNIGNRILDNEIYDCGDGVGVTWDDSGSNHYIECRDLIVEGNDIYLTDVRHLYRPEPVFPPNSGYPRIHATAENGIDIKTGPRTTTEPIKFVRNRIWGFRTPQPGSAQQSDGAAITIHRAAQRLLFTDNVIFDCPIAFHEVVRNQAGSNYPPDPNQGAREVTLRSNIISYMHPYNPEDLGAILRTKLPFRLEGNRLSHSRTLSALPKSPNTHDIFVDNVLHEDTPLDEAHNDWESEDSTNNKIPQAHEMSDILIERCRWTNPGLVRLTNAVLAGDEF